MDIAANSDYRSAASKREKVRQLTAPCTPLETGPIKLQNISGVDARLAFPFVFDAADIKPGTGAGRNSKLVCLLPAAIVKIVRSKPHGVTAQPVFPSGITTGGWGLTITPRDMARLGFLYLNRGRWDGPPVIPAGWIDESTAQNANGYGYYWWLRGKDATVSYSAAGSGGNLICCVPRTDLVVTIASKVAIAGVTASRLASRERQSPASDHCF